MGEVLKKFGRYFLLDHIAQGGMAEIFRARLASVDGGGRLVVIKRIQSGFGANADFIKMFRSEIKVTMGFNHSNIVQVYDFGEQQNQPYIAMEFVDGKTLRQCLARMSEKQQVFPVELAIYIVTQAACGLHYAHTYKDKLTGQPLNIVHRDISPQNIIISYEGNVKVIDFGIAKAATTTSELTRSGVIKGKPSYLSPEQISGEVLDGRCDIFSLGVVFWELLTGKKLFSGENDLAVLKLIDSCNTHVKPPSTLNAEVPRELDYIVLKALAKQCEKRFQTAEEFQRTLHKLLFSKNPDFDSVDLSFFVKNLFKDEIVEDRKFLQKINEKAEKLLASEFTEEAVPSEFGFLSTKLEDTVTPINPGVKVSSLRNVESLDAKNAKVEIEGVAKAKVIPSPGRASSAELDRSSFSLRTTGSIPVQLPQKTHKTSRSLPALLAVGLIGVLIYGFWFSGARSNRHLERGPSQEGSSRELKTSIFSPASVPAPVMTGKNQIALKFTILPWNDGAQVTLNGKLLDLSQPYSVAEMDTPLTLIAEMPQFRKFSRSIIISSDQLRGQKEWPLEIQFEPLVFGFLTLRTTPSADVIYLNGIDWRKRTPIQNEKLPVGQYTLRAVNEVLAMEKTVQIKIEEGKAISLDERLEVVDQK